MKKTQKWETQSKQNSDDQGKKEFINNRKRKKKKEDDEEEQRHKVFGWQTWKLESFVIAEQGQLEIPRRLKLKKGITIFDG